MASTFVNNLRLEEMTTGEQAGTWGTKTNTNLELIGEALGFATIQFGSDADATETVADGLSDSARSLFIKVTSSGNLTATRTLTIAPNDMKRVHIIENATSGSQSIAISQGSGADVTILNGQTKAVYLDGGGSSAAVVDAFVDLNLGGQTIVDDIEVTDDARIGDNLTFFSDSAVITFGADSDTTLTHTDGTGLTLNSTNKLTFGDVATFIHQNTDGSMTISGEANIVLTASDSISTTTSGTSNVKLGANAGNSIASGGNYNVLIGDEAGTAITTGDNNVAIGFEALKTEDAHGNNVAVGYQALRLQDGGDNNYNVAVGSEAGKAITTGAANTLIGGQAGDALTTGGNNVAVGYQALSTEDAHSRNTAIGYQSLLTQDAGANGQSTAVGYASGKSVTTGIENVFIGASAGESATTPSNTVAIGKSACGGAVLTGDNNTAVGYHAGLGTTSGTNNVIMGSLAGDAISTGNSNVAIGKSALSAETTGSNNIAIGEAALEDQNNTGSENTYNIAIGSDAGKNITTGQKNQLIGGTAGDALTDADFNVAIGFNALGNDQKGNRNVAVGHGALATQQFTSSQDSGNTAVGFGTGNAITDGVQNVFIGIDAGKNATTCNNVVAVGISAGGNATLSGNNNVMVGNSAGAEISSGVNNIAIGQDALRSGAPGGQQNISSNKIGLGDGSITSFHCEVSLSVASDERDKTDFTALDIGLDFVNDLKPYTYKWDKRIKYGDKTAEDYEWSTQTPDGTHKEDWLDIGFKAQEVEVLEKAKGYDVDKKTNLFISVEDNGKQYEMRYEKFVPLLVKAIQELSAKNDALEARIKTLEG